jgi:hypothetical protein
MLKIYMVYSRGAGSEEGAALVFAHSFQEARKVGWQSFGDLFTDEYIDLTAGLMRNHPWLYDEADKAKLAKDEPHGTIDPKSCNQCERWGQSPIGEDGLCEDCREDNKLDEIEDRELSIEG